MSEDDSDFEVTYCSTCNDSGVDPCFGGVCVDCKTPPKGSSEQLVAEMFRMISKSDPLMIKLKQNRITIPNLRLALQICKLDNERRLRQKNGFRRLLNTALWGMSADKQKSPRAVFEEAVDRAVEIKVRAREEEVLSEKRRLAEIEIQKRDSQRREEMRDERQRLYLEREKIRNIERVEIMRVKCRVEPLTRFPGWDVPWKSRCLDCNIEVSPRFGTVRESGWACAPCARKRFDDLKAASQNDERARLMEEVGGVTPIEPYKRSQSPWKCECKTCGSIVTPRFDDVINKHRRACIVCSRNEERVFAFDFKAPGIIYLLEHLDLGAIKVGISTTASKTDRIGQHELNGWTRINVWSVTTGFVAREVEQEILGWWRNEMKLLPGCSGTDMPQGGHTETVSAIEIDTDEVIQRIEKLIRLRGKESVDGK
jgi:hypothetical protein